MAEDLLLFGRAAAPGGGIPWSYKILGSQGSSGYYQLALEATDYARAHVSKFSLEQLLDALVSWLQLPQGRSWEPPPGR